MSRRRKEKNRKEKTRKTNQQRPRVSSSDLRVGVYYAPLSERGCTFTQRQQVSGTTNQWIVESYNPESLSPTFQGGTFAREVKRQAKLGA